MRHLMAVPQSVTVRSARQFANSLSDQFEAESNIDLDLSDLTEVDLAFVEILYAARMQWKRAGRELRLARPAEGALVALLERSGFLTDLTPQDLEFWFHGELPQ